MQKPFCIPPANIEKYIHDKRLQKLDSVKKLKLTATSLK